MSSERVERRLAAVLAADVAGYSRAGVTDAATMSRLVSRDGNDLLDQHRQPDPDDPRANHP